MSELPDEKLVSKVELMEFFSVSSPTLWLWQQKRGFPRPIQLSPACVRWRWSQVESWIKTRKLSPLKGHPRREQIAADA